MAPSFLQSPEWEEVQRRMGRVTWRTRSALVVHHDLPFGFHYLYAPRLATVVPALFDEIARYAERMGSLFLKVDPLAELPPAALSAVPSRSLQPPATILIDGRHDDAELLGAMHPKTRYNIRLAERRGVAVRMAGRPIAADDFVALMGLLADTARREGFSLHPAEHYRILLDVATPNFVNELFIAELGGQPLAAAIVNCYRSAGIATYLHGGSRREDRQVMAPHLLQWKIIQSCRERGMVAYDFGGIDEAHWPGVTRFKRSFGGALLTHPPSVDYVFRPFLYRLYRLRRAIRRSPR